MSLKQSINTFHKFKVNGFSLIEVLVTLAITTIGLVGLSAMQLEANRSIMDAGNRSQAVWVLQDLTHRIKANKSGVLDYHTNGEFVDCDNIPAVACSSYYDGNNQIIPAACSSSQIALYDLWDSTCSRDINVEGSSIVRSSSTDFISNPRLSVAVTVFDEVAGNPDYTSQYNINITMIWDARTQGVDADGNTVYISDSDLTENEITTRQITISSEFSL